MSESKNALIAEAAEVVADCERYLEPAARLMLDIPAKREAEMERRAALQERLRQVEEKWRRAHEASDSMAEWQAADAERARASRKVFDSSPPAIRSDELDTENRKGVARQMAGMVREEAEQWLKGIAARSDDPEVRRTVAERRDEVARVTHRFMREFAEARGLEHHEVVTTRAEARDILDRLKNPPADQ